MSRKSNKKNRRSVLKSIGGITAGSVGFLRGSDITRASPKNVDPNFDPYDFQEVDAFVKATTEDFSEEIGFKRNIATVANRLSSTQIDAIRDAVRPSVFETVETRSDTSTMTKSATIEQQFIGENPVEKWDWEVESHLGRSELNDEPTILRNSHSAQVHAYALSVDYNAYRWEAEIQWDADGSSVSNCTNGDTVLQKNHSIDYKGTDVDVYDTTSTYDVNFQATFDNDLGEYCDPTGSICIPLQSTFTPYIRLRGHADGSGETVSKSDGTLTP